MNEMTRLTSKRLPLRYIILLLLLTLSVSAVSLSRYSTTVAGSGSGRVARPVVAFEDNSEVTIAGMQPGETREYAFSVTNRGLNQVTMKYTLGVVTPDDWPISAVILKNGGEALGPAEWVTMDHSSVEIKHGYTLKLMWDKPGTASTIPWDMTIHLDAVQAD